MLTRSIHIQVIHLTAQIVNEGILQTIKELLILILSKSTLVAKTCGVGYPYCYSQQGSRCCFSSPLHVTLDTFPSRSEFAGILTRQAGIYDRKLILTKSLNILCILLDLHGVKSPPELVPLRPT